MHVSEGIADLVSKGARWLIGLALIALGAVLLAAVGTVPGVILVAIGTLTIPWFPGMGAGAGS